MSGQQTDNNNFDSQTAEEKALMKSIDYYEQKMHVYDQLRKKAEELQHYAPDGKSDILDEWKNIDAFRPEEQVILDNLRRKLYILRTQQNPPGDMPIKTFPKRRNAMPVVGYPGKRGEEKKFEEQYKQKYLWNVMPVDRRFQKEIRQVPI